MKTYTPEIDSGFLDEIKTVLNDSAFEILRLALENRTIKVTEIADIIINHSRDPEQFEDTMVFLQQIFSRNNIRVIFDYAVEAGDGKKLKVNSRAILHRNKKGVNGKKAVYVEKTPPTPSPETEKVLKIAGDDSNFRIVHQVRDIGKESIDAWYMRHLAGHQLLGHEKELVLIKAHQSGCSKSTEALVRHNQRLIIAIARLFYYWGLPFMDLIQEGNIGLMEAIDRFDLERGGHLSTYATWWIRQKMRRAIENQVHVVRMPSYVHSELVKLWHIANQFAEKHGREPTDADLFRAASATMKAERIVQLLDLRRRRCMSLDYDNEDGMAMHERFGDKNDVSPYVKAVSISQLDHFRRHVELIVTVIEELVTKGDIKPVWRDVFYLHYGLCGRESGLTLEEIGQQYNLTRERVRQISHRDMWRSIRKHKLHGKSIMPRREFETKLMGVPILENLACHEVRFVRQRDDGITPLAWARHK